MEITHFVVNELTEIGAACMTLSLASCITRPKAMRLLHPGAGQETAGRTLIGADTRVAGKGAAPTQNGRGSRAQGLAQTLPLGRPLEAIEASCPSSDDPRTKAVGVSAV